MTVQFDDKRSAAELDVFGRALVALQGIVLLGLSALLLAQAVTSLKWRLAHDTPLLHYVAFLMERHNMVPYRDIFETSMPGTFLFHYAIGATLGYGDLAFRIVDLALLGILLLVTYMFVSRFGSTPALWAVVVFGLVYLSAGQTMSLQRDYVGIIPVAFALLCLPAKRGAPVRMKSFAFVGLAFGLSALIKPHLVIALPVLFGALLAFRWDSQRRSWTDMLKCGVTTAASLMLPIAVAAIWLATNAALSPFISMFANYLPLHTALSGDHTLMTGISRMTYLASAAARLGGYSSLVLAALFGHYRALKVWEAQTWSLLCVLSCTGVYAFYTVLAGKFWDYHWMPFAFFASMSTALCLSRWPRPGSDILSRITETIPLMVIVVALVTQLTLPGYARSVTRQFNPGPEMHAPLDGRVDEIADFLTARLRPSDTVQPLDWTGGSIHAMLQAEARLASLDSPRRPPIRS